MKKWIVLALLVVMASSAWAIRAVIDGGSVDGTPIGGSTPSTVAATTVTASSSMQGLIPVLSDDTALDSTQVRGHIDLMTGTGTVAVSQAAVAGQSFCVYNTTAATTYIDPNGTDVIVLNGTALSAGYRINNNPTVAGDFICLVSTTANQWRTMGRSGTWVDSGS